VRCMQEAGARTSSHCCRALPPRWGCGSAFARFCLAWAAFSRSEPIARPRVYPVSLESVARSGAKPFDTLQYIERVMCISIHSQPWPASCYNRRAATSPTTRALSCPANRRAAVSHIQVMVVCSAKMTMHCRWVGEKRRLESSQSDARRNYSK